MAAAKNATALEQPYFSDCARIAKVDDYDGGKRTAVFLLDTNVLRSGR